MKIFHQLDNQAVGKYTIAQAIHISGIYKKPVADWLVGICFP